MYDDDLTTLMHDATEGLRPPVGAARSALRAAAVHRRRTAVAAGGSSLAMAGLIGVGLGQLPGRSAATIQVASGGSGLRTSTGTCATGPSIDRQTAAPAGTDPAFTILSLPQTLPGFPVNLWTSPTYDSYQGKDERLWGWDAKPAVHVGANEQTPGGPQIRLMVYDAPDCFAPDSHGLVEGRVVTGQRTVLGETALISHDSDEVWVSLSTANYSIEGQGGSGATVDDLVMEIEAIQGLDGTLPSPGPSADRPSPSSSDSSPGLVTSTPAVPTGQADSVTPVKRPLPSPTIPSDSPSTTVGDTQTPIPSPSPTTS